MAGEDLTVELFYDGTWNDLTDGEEVFATPITITQGNADESNALRPASVAMQLDNRSDKFRITNPLSPLYSQVGRNAPLRVTVGSSVRALTELSSISTDQTDDFREAPARGRAWADAQGGGLLRRINQWSKPIRSPFYRYNSRLTTLCGYWPGEDAVGTKQLFNPVSGSYTKSILGLEFQSQTRPAGSGPVLVMPSDTPTSIWGLFAPGVAASTAGWQFGFAINFGSIGGTGDFFPFMQWSTWDGKAFSLTWLDGSDLVLLVSDSDQTVLVNHTFSGLGGVSQWNEWQNFAISATYSGGTTTIGIRWNSEGVTSGIAGPYTQTYSGVTSSLRYFYTQPAAASTSIGHIIGTTGTSEDLLSSDRIAAFNGHVGELAAARFARLCEEENILYYVLSNWAESSPMGPQAVDSLPKLFKEIVDTDDGLIYDMREELRLIYAGRADRYRQTPALTLEPEDFPSLPKETFDDKGTWNVVTARQRDGGEATATEPDGAMGTADPPDGMGEKREDFDVSVSDEFTQLPQVANWWLRRGQVDLPRFPKLTLNLAGLSSAKIAQVNAVSVGSVIEIDGLRENVIRLHVIGWTEMIRPVARGKVQRTITFNCASDQQFYVGEWDATDSRWDLSTCTLNGAHSASAASLTLKMTADEAWSTTGVPYDLFIAGERVTVTAMGARTGSLGNYAQTATVTRGVNSISKTLPSGSEVHVATPGRWGL